MEADRALPLALGLVMVLAMLPATVPAEHGPDTLPAPAGFNAYRGNLHAHTAYSDGKDTPGEAIAQAKATSWLDFFVVTEHSEWFVFPWEANGDCIDPTDEGFLATTCFEPVTPLPERTEWDDIQHQADLHTDANFLAMRGFEWSSPIEGHVNVYFTDLWVDTVTTGPAPMTPFYAWLATTAHADAVATFNHPSREPLMFDDFEYFEPVDAQFSSVEAFNRDDDYSDEYLIALDRGWHVGAIGVTDGHTESSRLDPSEGHTVLLADELTEEGLRGALLAHRTVATMGHDLDGRITVNEAQMGSTIAAPADGLVSVQVRLLDAGSEQFTRYEVLGPDGFVHSVDVDPASTSVDDTVTIDLADVGTTDLGEQYLLVRGFQGSEAKVVTSPVWIT